jgi:segregation and condensation protein B
LSAGPGLDSLDVTAVVEALLFCADGPVSLKRLCELIPEAGRKEILEAIEALRFRNSGRDRGIELVEVAGGYRLQTKPEMALWIQRAGRKAPERLSRAAMETLAAIAYHQPVTRAEVERLRGVDSSGTIRGLLDRKLIRIAGRKDVPGRPLLYATTRRFLELFHLEDLDALPTIRELKEFSKASEEQQLPLFSRPA